MKNIFIGKPNAKFKSWCKKKYGRKDAGPVCFTANEPNTNVSFVACDINTFEVLDIFCHMQYSSDNKVTWNEYLGQIVYLDDCVDNKVYFRADPDNPNINGFISEDETKFHRFIVNGSVSVSGNIQYLLVSDGNRNDVPYMGFFYLFAECPITTAPELPASILGELCYYMMFWLCSSLTTTPELKATTLGDWCYDCMFCECTDLKSTSQITLQTAHSEMFCEDINLKTVIICDDKQINLNNSYIFYNCNNITDMYFPNLTIEQLKEKKYNGKNMLCGSGMSYDTLMSMTIHCKDGSFKYIIDDLFNFTQLKKKFNQDNGELWANSQIIGTATVSKGTINILSTFDPLYTNIAAGNVCPPPISRHVLVGCQHYPVKVTGPLTYTNDVTGKSCSVNRLAWTNLRNWADQNKDTYGWTDSDINGISKDVEMITLDKNTPVLDDFIYYNFDETSYAYLSSNLYLNGWYDYSIHWFTTSLAQHPQPLMTPLRTSSWPNLSIMNMIEVGSGYVLSSNIDTYLITYETDVKNKIKALTPCSNGQGGDSGLASFVRIGDKRVMIGNQYAAQCINGIPLYMRFIKAFVNAYEGTTDETCSLKIVTTNDLIEYANS